MSKHIGYKYVCKHCRHPFLPLAEEGKKCPYCGVCAVNENPPTIVEITEAAVANINWPIFIPWGIGDMYMLGAIGIIKKLIRNRIRLGDTLRKNALIQSVLDDGGFALKSQRDHAQIFLNSVICEFYKIALAMCNEPSTPSLRA